MHGHTGLAAGSSTRPPVLRIDDYTTPRDPTNPTGPTHGGYVPPGVPPGAPGDDGLGGGPGGACPMAYAVQITFDGDHPGADGDAAAMAGTHNLAWISDAAGGGGWYKVVDASRALSLFTNNGANTLWVELTGGGPGAGGDVGYTFDPGGATCPASGVYPQTYNPLGFGWPTTVQVAGVTP